MDHFTYTVYDEHAGAVDTYTIQTSTDINWAKVTGTLNYMSTSSYSFSKQHNYSTTGQYTITIKINYRQSIGSVYEGCVTILWGDGSYTEFIPRLDAIKSASGSVYDGTGGTKHPLKNTQIKYYIIK